MKYRQNGRRALLALWALTVALTISPAASAQLINRKSTRPNEEGRDSNVPLAEQMAKVIANRVVAWNEQEICRCEKPLAERNANHCGGTCTQGARCVLPDAIAPELPKLVVMSRFLNNCIETKDVEKTMTGIRAATDAFKREWTPIEARQHEVTEAIQKSRTFAAAGKFGQAKETLFSVITASNMEADRTMKAFRKEILRATDAEVPALKELELLARDAKDPFLLPEIGPAMIGRREVYDRPSEEVIWFAAHVAGVFSNPAEAKLHRQLLRDIEEGAKGRALAVESYLTWDKLGLTRGFLLNPDSAKAGVFGVFSLLIHEDTTLNKVKVSKNGVSLDINIRGATLMSNCTETNKIDHIDPITGRVIYREACDFKKMKDKKVSLTAKLSAEPPDWALGEISNPDDKDHAGINVIGKVKQQGLNWVLTDARVVDLHYLPVHGT